MYKKLYSDPDIYLIEVPMIVRFNFGSPGDLNAYLIRGEGGDLLIDAGFGYESCREPLFAALRALDVELSRLTVYLTHLHPDHAGLSVPLAAAGARVLMGERELAFYNYYRENGRQVSAEFMRSMGVPKQIDRTSREIIKMVISEAPVAAEPIGLGESIAVGGSRLVQLPAPGHTAGHTALYWPEKKLLFPGDHILFHCKPSISIWGDERDSIAKYLGSLREYSALEIEGTLTGHGCTGDVYERIDFITDYHRRHVRDLCAVAEEFSGCTAYQAAEHLAMHVFHQDWPQISPVMQTFVTYEVMAHLFFAEQSGLLLSALAPDGRRIFTPAHV